MTNVNVVVAVMVDVTGPARDRHSVGSRGRVGEGSVDHAAAGCDCQPHRRQKQDSGQSTQLRDARPMKPTSSSPAKATVIGTDFPLRPLGVFVATALGASS